MAVSILRYQLTDTASVAARTYELSVPAIVEMVRNSAIVTHPQGNRRFKEYIFEVSDMSIKRVTKLRPVVIPTTGLDEFVAYEECDYCSGRGCHKCGGIGEITVVRKLRPHKFGPMS